ncbi:hypothetical protein NKG05_17075 [Oerskovia sp. M15]
MASLPIRPARVTDPAEVDRLYDICLRTGADGGDATASYRDPRLLGEIYLGAYLALEPDLAFVVDDGTGAIGYVVGTRDTRAFEERCEREWWPSLRDRYPLDTFPAGTADRHLVTTMHNPSAADPALLGPYPAHLHVDLLPEAQGGGNGRRLLETLFDALRERDVTGVHLGSRRPMPRRSGSTSTSASSASRRRRATCWASSSSWLLAAGCCCRPLLLLSAVAAAVGRCCCCRPLLPNRGWSGNSGELPDQPRFGTLAQPAQRHTDISRHRARDRQVARREPQQLDPPARDQEVLPVSIGEDRVRVSWNSAPSTSATSHRSVPNDQARSPRAMIRPWSSRTGSWSTSGEPHRHRSRAVRRSRAGTRTGRPPSPTRHACVPHPPATSHVVSAFEVLDGHEPEVERGVHDGDCLPSFELRDRLGEGPVRRRHETVLDDADGHAVIEHPQLDPVAGPSCAPTGSAACGTTRCGRPDTPRSARAQGPTAIERGPKASRAAQAARRRRWSSDLDATGVASVS